MHVGIFLVAFATLMFEILITRIFSVTMWYHFAFLAVSVSMFGMTVGAVIVYLYPKAFSGPMVRRWLTFGALGFSVSLILCIGIHLQQRPLLSFSLDALLRGQSIFWTYLLIAVPFVFSGICICLLLTKYPRQVSSLYAADLCGAAAGCYGILAVLNYLDGPTALLFVAACAALAALFFLPKDSRRPLRLMTHITVMLVLFGAVVGVAGYQQGDPLLRIRWQKGVEKQQALYERWNAFSQITVNPSRSLFDFGWGLSSVIEPPDHPVLMLLIDQNAGTVLTRFDGDFSEIEHVKYDVTNLVHAVKQDAHVLIIGAGGGKDVLSALAFNQRKVTAVELNEAILDAANVIFGEFTGHLDRYPQVEIIGDEARSYVARSDARFDIIQVSLIDTWAATAAGAFVLSENSLYTLEAWDLFLDKLSEGGMLSFSRWYIDTHPAEMHRLVALAAESLRRAGVREPSKHILVARNVPQKGKSVTPAGVGTLIVKKSPVTEDEAGRFRQRVEALAFELMFSPTQSADPAFDYLTAAEYPADFIRSYPLNISPPTDDSPFFFNMLRLRDVFKSGTEGLAGYDFNLKAVQIVLKLLLAVTFLALFCIVLPVALRSRSLDWRRGGTWFWLLYFASIGFGFMLVEIAQLQRLTVFLGHPTYSLAVVLFAILFSSGLGSLWTHHFACSGKKVLLVLLAMLLFVGWATPWCAGYFASSVTVVRIGVASLLLCCIGFPMGMAFPLGMRAASREGDGLTPWLWAVNGATSVVASVLAIVIALAFGISAAYAVGVACYVFALIAYRN